MLKVRHLILVSLTVLALALPHFADARAGGGKSMGSRGARTYSSPNNYKAQPIQRSTTPKQNQQQNMQPGIAPQQPDMANTVGGSFWRGMAGGFLGAGIGSLLFGSHGYAGGAGSGTAGAGSGALGSLMQILLISGMAYLGYRLFRGRGHGGASPASNFGNNFSANNAFSGSAAQVDTGTPINITDTDKHAFENILQKIQHHWSDGDLARLRMFATPEMVQYFSDELSSNASRGLANKVENVTLEYAEILESWREYDLDYATARLKWTALDYMARLDKNADESGYIASGSDTDVMCAEEIWTFARSGGGNWLLSAIQQIG